MVTVNYTGWTTDGKSSTVVRAQRAQQLPLDRVIKGWGEGVQLMVVGEKRRSGFRRRLPITAWPAGPRACWYSTSSCST